MTRVSPPPTAHVARVAAEAAASRSGVAVRELTSVTDLAAVTQLFHRIWRPAPDNPPVTSELLVALAKGGGYVAGAFDGAELVGAGVGFFGPPGERSLHSHIAGVSASAQGRNVGFALKVHQRAWALQRGATAISWTFDPLVRRNAHFNLAKLGAVPVEYLTNFYGGMHDAINAGDESDRLLVRWPLEDGRVAAACEGRSAARAPVGGAAVALAVGDDGGPDARSVDHGTLLVDVPPDIESTREADPELARRWRTAVRDVLGTLMDHGGQVTGFDRTGGYVVRRAAQPRETAS